MAYCSHPGSDFVKDFHTGEVHCGLCGVHVFTASLGFNCPHPLSQHRMNNTTGDVSCLRCGAHLGNPANGWHKGHFPSFSPAMPSPDTPAVVEPVHIKINCPHCWKEVELSEDYLLAIATEQKVNLQCCEKVPVTGDNGILARVARAKQSEQWAIEWFWFGVKNSMTGHKSSRKTKAMKLRKGRRKAKRPPTLIITVLVVISYAIISQIVGRLLFYLAYLDDSAV